MLHLSPLGVALGGVPVGICGFHDLKQFKRDAIATVVPVDVCFRNQKQLRQGTSAYSCEHVRGVMHKV